MAQSTPAPANDPLGALQDNSTQQSRDPAGTSTEKRRFYLGPRGSDAQNDARGDLQNSPWEDADHAPTSILIGPYVPKQSIAIPSLDEPQESPDTVLANGAAQPDGDADLSTSEAGESLDPNITVDALSQLDPAAIGVWTDRSVQPFPITMWQGSQRETLERLIPALPAQASSTAMRSLMRRLLLSPASLPSKPVALASPEADISLQAQVLDETGFETRPSAFPDAASQADPETANPLSITAETLTAPPDENPDQGMDEAQAQGSDLLMARLERLYAAGAVDDFLALSERLPADLENADLDRMRTHAALAIGDYETACQIAQQAIVQSGAALWLRVTALCEAFEGNRGTARFKLTLLDDANEASPAFSALVEALLDQIEGRTAPTDALDLSSATELTPELFAASQLTATPLPGTLIRSAPEILLVALSQSPTLSTDDRLALAQKAAQKGLMDGAQLAEIFASLSFTDAQRAAVFASLEAEQDRTAESENDPAGQQEMSDEAAPVPTNEALLGGIELDALLWQLAAKSQSPHERIRWIEIALERGRSRGLITAMAGALAEPLEAITASMALAGYADSAGRIHLLNGRAEDAVAWYEAARLAADQGNLDARRALLALWPLMAVMDETGHVAIDPDMLTLWMTTHSGRTEHEQLSRADLLFTVLEGLGKPVPFDLQQRALTAPLRHGPIPPATLWRQLIQAITSHRTGETVLTTLVALGEDGPAFVSAPVLSTLLVGLREAGLEQDSRRLAMEA
ncbi:hypothetical protein JCM17844_13810 [Iodidimonas gelatinilytica]|uniref:Uncharacterized protein n=2 Tax=Iodidimonas gelatinilytica TaxID=1236966 RepID=A0A5A7MQ42_9PROT|nr:hypothetical protein JCM17844_13810 [Iodidimonas gelatinilytica]